jgi:ribose transport system permease protein
MPTKTPTQDPQISRDDETHRPSVRGPLLPALRSVAVRALPVTVLLILVAYFSARSDLFFSVDNGFNVLREGSILLIVAVGATFVILQGGIDLAVGANATLTGVVVAFLVSDFGFGVTAFPAGMLFGAGIGLCIGILVAYVKVPSFLVTLGLLSVLAGIGNFLTDGSNKSAVDLAFSDAVRGNWVFGVPNLFLWAAVVFCLAAFLQNYTKFGRYTYAIGGGELVSVMAGVPVARYKMYAFLFSGATAGLAGALLTARLGSGGPGLGAALMLQSITAVAIGGTALTGGVGGVGRTLLGVLVVTVLTNGMILTQVDAYTQQIVTGIVLIVAVTLSLDRRRVAVIK